MVNYQINKDLFGNNILLVTGLPKNDITLKIDDVNNKEHIHCLVNKAECDAYRLLICDMVKARKNAFNYVANASNFDHNKLNAITELNTKLGILIDCKFSNVLAERIKISILPLLYTIAPALGSKFYVNYFKNLNKIETFIKNNSK